MANGVVYEGEDFAVVGGFSGARLWWSGIFVAVRAVKVPVVATTEAAGSVLAGVESAIWFGGWVSLGLRRAGGTRWVFAWVFSSVWVVGIVERLG